MDSDPFCAVALWYGDFSETTDDEVRRLLSLSTTDTAHQRSASTACDETYGPCNGRVSTGSMWIDWDIESSQPSTGRQRFEDLLS